MQGTAFINARAALGTHIFHCRCDVKYRCCPVARLGRQFSMRRSSLPSWFFQASLVIAEQDVYQSSAATKSLLSSSSGTCQVHIGVSTCDIQQNTGEFLPPEEIYGPDFFLRPEESFFRFQTVILRYFNLVREEVCSTADPALAGQRCRDGGNPHIVQIARETTVPCSRLTARSRTRAAPESSRRYPPNFQARVDSQQEPSRICLTCWLSPQVLLARHAPGQRPVPSTVPWGSA